MPYKKDDYEEKPLDHPLAELAYFTCASSEALRHIYTTEVFLFAVLSQSKWEGEG